MKHYFMDDFEEKVPEGRIQLMGDKIVLSYFFEP
jgi:hypothetical protein